jgi:hypothetical protein
VVGGARAAVLGGTIFVNIFLLFRQIVYRGYGRAYPWTLRRRPTPTVLRM